MAKTLHCSFCGKSDKQIEKLAAGPGGIHICNECVGICVTVMDGEGSAGMRRRLDPTTWPTERLIETLAPVSSTLDAYREHLHAIVEALRDREVSWARIAQPLGISRQSAWERFGGG
jgi:hypothetical protein